MPSRSVRLLCQVRDASPLFISCSASCIASYSMRPPPIVPAMLPSGRTHIEAPRLRGVEPLSLVTVQSTPNFPACTSSLILFKSSIFIFHLLLSFGMLFIT